MSCARARGVDALVDHRVDWGTHIVPRQTLLTTKSDCASCTRGMGVVDDRDHAVEAASRSDDACDDHMTWKKSRKGK